MIYVKLRRVGAAFWCIWVPFAENLDSKYDSIAVCRLFSDTYKTTFMTDNGSAKSYTLSFIVTNAGSTFNGTRPIRCERTSSTTTLVLFHTYTCSMQTVGTCTTSETIENQANKNQTSAIIILRNAFAIEASTPTRSNSTDRCDSRCIWTFRLCPCKNEG